MSVIRILDEEKLGLEEARPVMGTGGKLADFTTVYRAVTKGNLLPNGQRLCLEAVRISGQWVTSREAIGHYVEAMTLGWTNETGERLTMPSKSRANELARVDAEPAAVGIQRRAAHRDHAVRQAQGKADRGNPARLPTLVPGQPERLEPDASACHGGCPGSQQALPVKIPETGRSKVREAVKTWYRRASLKCQPDHGGNTDTQIIVNDCYESLVRAIESELT
jgi:hypothetical protein